MKHQIILQRNLVALIICGVLASSVQANASGGFFDSFFNLKKSVIQLTKKLKRSKRAERRAKREANNLRFELEELEVLLENATGLPDADVPDVASDFAGAVYAMSNDFDNNSIVGYGRNNDGTLTLIGEFETGGEGGAFDGGEGLDPLIFCVFSALDKRSTVRSSGKCRRWFDQRNAHK